jgi:hypothetical protein
LQLPLCTWLSSLSVPHPGTLNIEAVPVRTAFTFVTNSRRRYLRHAMKWNCFKRGWIHAASRGVVIRVEASRAMQLFAKRANLGSECAGLAGASRSDLCPNQGFPPEMDFVITKIEFITCIVRLALIRTRPRLGHRLGNPASQASPSCRPVHKPIFDNPTSALWTDHEASVLRTGRTYNLSSCHVLLISDARMASSWLNAGVQYSSPRHTV